MSQTPEAELTNPTDGPADESAPLGWEDDENQTTLFLRASMVLVAGALLLWTQHQAPVDSGSEWGKWIWVALLCNLILPLGIVWLFFAQVLSHLDWLKDQKYNAWSYGWSFGDWKRHLKIAGIIFALMLPLLWYYSHVPEVRAYYVDYFPPVETTRALLMLLATTLLYMLCWEWFFRGFLLFGLAQGYGFIFAILLQAGLFGMAHWGKPREEMISSFAGGAILGILCWREKSFAPAFYAHALIHLAWILLIFYS